MESLASYHGPESCAGGGNAAGEALTGGNAGQPLRKLGEMMLARSGRLALMNARRPEVLECAVA